MMHKSLESLIVICRWRIDEGEGRTIYAMGGNIPGGYEVLIGMMDSKMIAAAAVHAHNGVLESAGFITTENGPDL